MMPSDRVWTVDYGSCYVYSPFGRGEICERSRLMRSLLKDGNPYFIQRYVHRVRQQTLESAPLRGFFCSADVLIPVPGCTPRDNDQNVSSQLARALLQEGLGCEIWAGLKRVRAVHKSATALGRRPTVAMHYESFVVEPWAKPGGNVILIDDVVTKGRTLLAAAMRLQEAFPAARLRAFAMLRTMGLQPRVEQLIDPWCGLIRWYGGDAHRDS